MIKYEETPEDNSELGKMKVEFPKLSPGLEETCPAEFKDVIEYLEVEAMAQNKVASNTLKFEFLRTAMVEETQYWIWRFFDDNNEECPPDGVAFAKQPADYRVR
jgi:hypothetical protein